MQRFRYNNIFDTNTSRPSALFYIVQCYVCENQIRCFSLFSGGHVQCMYDPLNRTCILFLSAVNHAIKNYQKLSKSVSRSTKNTYLVLPLVLYYHFISQCFGF